MRSYYLLALVMVFYSFKASAQKNLISNGDFEDGLIGWNFGNGKITSVIQKSGESSLAIVSYVKGKWEAAEQNVKLPKNTKAISVSGYSRTDQVEQGVNNWNKAVIILEFTNGDKKIGQAIPLVEKAGTEDWTAFKKALKVPDTATGFRLMVALSEASGTFFVDDIAANLISIEDFEKENMPSN